MGECAPTFAAFQEIDSPSDAETAGRHGDLAVLSVCFAKPRNGVSSMSCKDSPIASKRPARTSRWLRELAPPAVRARSNVSARATFPHPFSWWRVRAPDDFKKVDVFVARHILRKSAIIGEPHWFLGAAGDAAIAINVARRAQTRDGVSLVSLDVAMTAVLCIALEGDVAAALFLSAALKRRSEFDSRCAALSDGWISYNSNRLTSLPTQMGRRE